MKRTATKRNVIDLAEVKKKLAQFDDKVNGQLSVAEGIEKKYKKPIRVYRKQLKMVLSLIPIAEKAYRATKTQSSAYALASLIEKSHELIAKIDALKGAKQSEKVVQNILDPMMEAFIKNLMHDLMEHKKQMKDLVGPTHGERIDAMVQSMMESFRDRGREIYEKVKQDLTDELG